MASFLSEILKWAYFLSRRALILQISHSDINFWKETNVKSIIIFVLTLVSAPVFAAKFDEAKCSDIVGTTGDRTPRYLAILDGYNSVDRFVL